MFIIFQRTCAITNITVFQNLSSFTDSYEKDVNGI